MSEVKLLHAKRAKKKKTAGLDPDVRWMRENNSPKDCNHKLGLKFKNKQTNKQKDPEAEI